MRILVVEDEPGIAHFIRQGLTEAGHAVDLAWNGREGLDFALAAEYDVLLLDISKVASFADYFVIASGQTVRQLKVMVESVDEGLSPEGVEPQGHEGDASSGWALLDYGDVIVHLFRPEVRSFYNLEKMWGVDLVAADGETERTRGVVPRETQTVETVGPLLGGPPRADLPQQRRAVRPV